MPTKLAFNPNNRLCPARCIRVSYPNKSQCEVKVSEVYQDGVDWLTNQFTLTSMVQTRSVTSVCLLLFTLSHVNKVVHELHIVSERERKSAQVLTFRAWKRVNERLDKWLTKNNQYFLYVVHM